jgi:hypothetical protein
LSREGIKRVSREESGLEEVKLFCGILGKRAIFPP